MTSTTAAAAQHGTTGTQQTTAGRRPPASAVVAIGLTVLAAVVGGYGACYFTGLDGWTPISETFVVTYLAFSLFGLAVVGSMVFGSGALRSAARYGLATYGVWMIGFTTFKLVRFSEYQAIPFGIVGLAILVLGLSRPTRSWAN